MQKRPKSRIGEPLGGDVGKGEAAGPELAEAASHLGGVEGRGQIGGRDAARLEGPHLILHERDER